MENNCRELQERSFITPKRVGLKRILTSPELHSHDRLDGVAENPDDKDLPYYVSPFELGFSNHSLDEVNNDVGMFDLLDYPKDQSLVSTNHTNKIVPNQRKELVVLQIAYKSLKLKYKRAKEELDNCKTYMNTRIDTIYKKDAEDAKSIFENEILNKEQTDRKSVV